MINLIPNKTEGQSGFIPLTAGEHICPSSHSYGPYIRDHYIIHFCLSGKGTLYNSSGAHPVAKPTDRGRSSSSPPTTTPRR